MDNHSDDLMLWRLECMSEEPLRWLIGMFIEYAADSNAHIRELFAKQRDYRDETGR